MLLTVYAILMVVLWVGVSSYLIAGSRKITYLKDVSLPTGTALPSVAVIIAVKDEEAEVEAALQSVCALDYPNLEIIVLNDRSTDGTAAILERMATAYPGLSTVTIRELAPGWLGKNHALYKGYQASSAEWLLFTDADVLFDRLALQKAMAYALEHRLDHLTALPQVTSRSGLFKAVMNTFALMLDIKLRPWNIANPSSKESMGVGAFNLVRRSAYEKAGTHAVISLRPDDDLKLGERIKGAGLRQDLVYGVGTIWLEWYTSLAQFVKGLMKNTFSVSNYQLPVALGTAITTFLIVALPVPLLLLSGTPYLWAGLLIQVAQIAVMLFKKGFVAKWWHALLIPFSGLVMVYIIVVSALLTLKQGGIYWRNSFYPLAELRKQR